MKGFLTELIIISVLLILPLSAASGVELEGYNITKKLINLEKSGPPDMVDNYIVFSFEGRDKPGFVGAAFEFENYTKIHQYKKIQDENIYYLVINKPDVEEIKYRVIVDGIWQADPHSLYKLREESGVEISVFPLPEIPDNEAVYPYTENNYTYFYHRGKPGSSVYLSGSFNNWDPFMYLMREKRPGEYYIKLRLNPGKHYYYFLENGVKISDRRNPELVWDTDFDEISSFLLEAE